MLTAGPRISCAPPFLLSGFDADGVADAGDQFRVPRRAHVDAGGEGGGGARGGGRSAAVALAGFRHHEGRNAQAGNGVGGLRWPVAPRSESLSRGVMRLNKSLTRALRAEPWDCGRRASRRPALATMESIATRSRRRPMHGEYFLNRPMAWRPLMGVSNRGRNLPKIRRAMVAESSVVVVGSSLTYLQVWVI